MSTDEPAARTHLDPVEVVKRIYQMLAAGDLEGVLAHVSDDVSITQDAALPWGGQYHGHDGLAAFGLALTGTIDSEVTHEALYGAGDRVVQFGRTRGTVRSSGAVFDVPECHLWTIEDGQVVAAEFYIDTTAMLKALASPARPERARVSTVELTLEARTATERPKVWVGHAGPLRVPDLDRAIDFYSALGLRLIHRSERMAALQLRGGTHLALEPGSGEPGVAPFDLMVDDLDGYRSELVEAGLAPTTIEQLRAHARFTIIDPAGTEVRVHDSHVVGPA
jgi:ketosteroid isomerase-like protein